MKKEIQKFRNEQFGEIRTMVDEKGEPWFVGKDVAEKLGYSNTRDALKKHVEEEDKTTVAICDTGSNYKSQAVVINESGLYSLVLASKLPQAKAFKRWVTSEVLPQIRKTGGYIPLKDQEGRELSDLEIMCRAMEIMQKSIEQKEQLIADLQPKADYADEVLDSIDCMTMTQVAKGEGMTVHELTHLLLQKGIIYCQSGCYMLYAKYADKGLAAYRTHSHRDLFGSMRTNIYLVWTERGRKFIHEIIDHDDDHEDDLNVSPGIQVDFEIKPMNQ